VPSSQSAHLVSARIFNAVSLTSFAAFNQALQTVLCKSRHFASINERNAAFFVGLGFQHHAMLRAMSDPVITLQRANDCWQSCPFCSNAPIGTSLEEKQAHYVSVHGYMEVDGVADGVGRTLSLELERPQLVHGPITLYQEDPAANPTAECYELWCVASIRGLYFLRMLHAWWLEAEKRAHALSHVLTQPCKTKAEVVAEFDAEIKKLESEGWVYKLQPGFDPILGVPIAIRLP
jgi:hypothetical protein